MGSRVIIAGTGMEQSMSMTVGAKNAAENADILIGAKRILEGFGHLNKVLFSSYDSREIAEFIAENISFLNYRILIFSPNS